MLNIPRAGIIGIYHHAQLSGNFSSDDVLGQILLSFFFFKFIIGFLSYENEIKGLTL